MHIYKLIFLGHSPLLSQETLKRMHENNVAINR